MNELDNSGLLITCSLFFILAMIDCSQLRSISLLSDPDSTSLS